MPPISVMDCDNIAIVGHSRCGLGMAEYFRKMGKSVELCPGRQIDIDLLRRSNIIFIAVKDDCIQSVSCEIGHMQLDFPHKTFCHFSGSLSDSVLSQLADLGAEVCSLHPAFTFTGDISNISSELKLCYQGDLDTAVVELLKAVDASFISINREQKVLYHTACVFASNYLTVVLWAAEDILKDISFPDGVDFLKQLIMEACTNTIHKGAKNALTGPAIRGDLQTIQKHKHALRGNKWESLYNNMLQIIQNYH